MGFVGAIKEPDGTDTKTCLLSFIYGKILRYTPSEVVCSTCCTTVADSLSFFKRLELCGLLDYSTRLDIELATR